MSYKIVALPGDGIGPEILSGTELLKLISEKYHFEYHLKVIIWRCFNRLLWYTFN